MAKRTKTNGPHSSGLILCERVLQDLVNRDAVTCVNIFNGLSAQSFPMLMPVAYAFAQVTGASGPFEYEYKIVDGDGNIVALSQKSRVDPQPGTDETTSHKVISAFNGLGFEKEGLYAVILEIDGVEAAELPLKVTRIMPQVVSGQASGRA
ncbi:MAG: hypothetical protein H6677_24520 [Candidatus Obscuribacterales bacterium]|nr:hypothetical protein [Cyanobacteria bacterium HKST-UBA01]MCB9471462.1 hypothetical protein [Candidatus Obscuribacterales bacterium]